MIRRALLALPLLGLAACVPDQRPMTGMSSCDTRFRVANNSTMMINEVYFSHASMSDWGSDQLGNDTLAPGNSQAFRASQTGYYDFKIVWANGQKAELRQVDICRASTISVSNAGLRAS